MRACKGRELDLTTPEQRALFGELDPVPMCFLQLVGKRYPLKAVRTLEKKKKKKERKKWKKKKIISFRQSLLGSIRPFPEPIQFLVLGASLSSGRPPKRGRINQRRDFCKRIEPGKVRFCFLSASQTRFAQGELISGSAMKTTISVVFRYWLWVEKFSPVRSRWSVEKSQTPLPRSRSESCSSQTLIMNHSLIH